MDFSKYFPDGILVGSPIKLSDCRILRPYLLGHAGFTDDQINKGSVMMLAVPYAVPCRERTVSMYAVAEDYHAYFAALFDAVLPAMRADFPDHIFAGFADHSPIAEVDAACKAGLGVQGENGLLLTDRHSSYVFLGEIVTTLQTDNQAQPIGHCLSCGACRSACPVHLCKQECLSDLTQKKGELDALEIARLEAHPYVWGCDVCQDVCPYTIAAKHAGTLYTEIPYFKQNLIPAPDLATLQGMSDKAFARRAYAWRGRDTICRNLRVKEEKQQP